MSQTDSFYIPNLAGAPFRNLLNQILEALSKQNAGSTEPPNPFSGMVWLDTSSDPAVFKQRNEGNTGWIKIFTADNPPTKAQVGLSNVPNYSATASLTDGSNSKFLLAAAGKSLQDNKVDKSGVAYDSARLGNKLASQYVLISGTYANLRAQATTKADVDLGNVQNYGLTSSLTSNNASQYLSAKGGYDLNQMKVNKTITINGHQLTGNITLTAANVGALPAGGGDLGGPINYTPDTGDIIKLDGKVLLRRISANGGVSFGADDAVIIGSGESRNTLQSNVSVTAEETHIGSDGAIKLYTNLQSGWASRKMFQFESDGGFLPGNIEKTRQNLEVYSTGETYSKSQVYAKGETYSRGEVDGLIPVTGYALVSFGTVSINTRYVKTNPFGNNTPVIVLGEIYVNGKWSQTGFIYSTNGYGTHANFVQGEGIVVQTGGIATVPASRFGGGGHNISTSSSVAYSCRVHVWRLGE